MKKLSAVALVVLPLLLAACGNKGPLVKPSQVPPDEPVPMPADALRVEPAAADDAVPAPVVAPAAVEPATAEPATAEPAPAATPEPAPPAADSDD